MQKRKSNTLLKVKSARKEFSLKNATNIPVRLESIANSQQRQDLIIGLVLFVSRFLQRLFLL